MQTSSLGFAVVGGLLVVVAGFLALRPWRDGEREAALAATQRNDAAMEGLRDEVRSLSDVVRRLEAELSNRPVAEPPRRETEASKRAEIERVVRAILAEQAEAPVGAASPADGEFDVELAVAQLLEIGQYSTRGDELWVRIREAGKVDEVVAAFEQRMRENPNSADAHADLGDAYVQQLLGSTDAVKQATISVQADRQFDEALDIDERHWRARFSKAMSYTFWPDFLGKKAEAIRHFEVLTEQQQQGPARPGYEQTWLILGNLYEQQGKEAEARTVWERGLGLHPDSSSLREKLR